MSTKSPDTDATFGMRHVTVVPTNFRTKAERDARRRNAGTADEEADADRE